MNIYNIIIDNIYNILNKSINNNFLIKINNYLNFNHILLNIKKILLCNIKNNNIFCNNCINCKLINLNIHPDIYLINNNIDYEKFNDINYIFSIINKEIYILPIYSKFKILFIYNIDLLYYNLINLILKLSNKYIKYIIFILIFNNIKNVNLYFKTKCTILNLENINNNYDINIIKNIFEVKNILYIKSSLNLCNNSIIKSYLLLKNINWNKRLKFINLLEKNLFNGKLLFIFDLINFKELEICNPIFWFITFILDSIKIKNKINKYKNIDSLILIKKISYNFSYSILINILDELLKYFYISNKNDNINKEIILMKSILNIEKILNSK